MYVLDTSALVQAQKSYYARDIVPAFWSALRDLHASGVVTCVDRVLDEIKQYGNPEDPLTVWAVEEMPASAFPSTSTEQVVEKYTRLIAWVDQQPRFGLAALDKFARGADGWVVAHAWHHGLTVVSMEVSAPQSKTDARMPDVCSAHGVAHVDTYTMLRAVGALFS